MKAARWYSLLWLWIIIVSTHTMAAFAEPGVVVPELSVYEQLDGSPSPLATASVEDLERNFDFKVEQSGTNKGYSFSPHWVLIPLAEVLTRLPQDQERWLEYGYPAVDAISVYASTGNGWIQIGQTGDQSPAKTRQRHGPNYYFRIPPDTDYMLVRLQTIGSLQFPFAVYSEPALGKALLDDGVVNGLFFGALIIMIFYNLFVFLMARDAAYLYYVYVHFLQYSV